MPASDRSARSASPLARLPVYYGWVVVAVAFVTMAIGVNTRTAFSLLYPQILDEFGWDRGVTAAVFSVGFLSSILISPFIGLAMDRFGPRIVIPVGVISLASGLTLATVASTPLQLYLTLGVLVVGGAVLLSYNGHSFFLPFWFVRRRGLAIGIAFSGVGVGSIILFPWVQRIIESSGWREACWTMAILLVVVLLPLNFLLQRRRPEDLGLRPDGDPDPTQPGAEQPGPDNIVNQAWAATDWHVFLAMRTRPFWWLFLAYVTGLYAWYAVQVHQIKYLVEGGFSPEQAALALGFVGLSGIAGQISIGHLSDRIGREWAWSISAMGFVICYLLLLLLNHYPSSALMYLMAASQGLLGYGMASVYGAMPAELFQSRRYGPIFGMYGVAAGLGAGGGPWVTGLLHDRFGTYTQAFWLAIAASVVSAICVWFAAPRKVRLVAGQAARRGRVAMSAPEGGGADS
ncbi:MAG: MFS transporter [SAR324 cluster bacterium]|nr:MFS transporter [SAR324 cluster bacterium]